MNIAEVIYEKVVKGVFTGIRFNVGNNCFLKVSKMQRAEWIYTDFLDSLNFTGGLNLCLVDEDSGVESETLELELENMDDKEASIDDITTALIMFAKRYPAVQKLLEKTGSVPPSEATAGAVEKEDKAENGAAEKPCVKKEPEKEAKKDAGQEAAGDTKPEKPNRIEIPLYGNTKLVAEMNPEKDFREIFVGVEKGDVWYQDLAIIREDYCWSDCEETYGVEYTPKHGNYEVQVFADCNDEDWTDSFQIKEYQEPEPETVSELSAQDKEAFKEYLKKNFKKLWKECKEDGGAQPA